MRFQLSQWCWFTITIQKFFFLFWISNYSQFCNKCSEKKKLIYKASEKRNKVSQHNFSMPVSSLEMRCNSMLFISFEENSFSHTVMWLIFFFAIVFSSIFIFIEYQFFIIIFFYFLFTRYFFFFYLRCFVIFKSSWCDARRYC
jgi:hypothetical protein